MGDYFEQTQETLQNAVKLIISSITIPWDEIHIETEYVNKPGTPGVMNIKSQLLNSEKLSRCIIPGKAKSLLYQLRKINTSEKGDLKKTILTITKDLKFTAQYEY